MLDEIVTHRNQRDPIKSTKVVDDLNLKVVETEKLNGYMSMPDGRDLEVSGDEPHHQLLIIRNVD